MRPPRRDPTVLTTLMFNAYTRPERIPAGHRLSMTEDRETLVLSALDASRTTWIRFEGLEGYTAREIVYGHVAKEMVRAATIMVDEAIAAHLAWEPEPA